MYKFNKLPSSVKSISPQWRQTKHKSISPAETLGHHVKWQQQTSIRMETIKQQQHAWMTKQGS